MDRLTALALQAQIESEYPHIIAAMNFNGPLAGYYMHIQDKETLVKTEIYDASEWEAYKEQNPQ